jgi:hypothetical protein
MVRGTQRPVFNGSALVRLLASLADVEVAGPAPGFAERLGQWLHWTDAVSLSAALEGQALSNGAVDAAPAGCGQASDAWQMRAAWIASIAHDPAFAPERESAHAAPPDFLPFRRRYTARQQALEAGIATLRAGLRASLAQGSPAMARLAALDAVMEQVLGVRERAQLSCVPGWLEKHFERLRTPHHADRAAHRPHEPAPRAASRPAAWLDAFCTDMRAVLLAELDLRWQPVDALLEALGPNPSANAS